MDTRVVITGIGCLLPFNLNFSLISDDLFDSKSENYMPLRTNNNEEIIKIPQLEISKILKDIKKPIASRYSQIAISSCDIAFQDSNLVNNQFEKTDIGIIYNTDFGPNESVENYLLTLLKSGPEKVSPIAFTRTVSNTTLGEITRYFNLSGPSSVTYGENSLCYGFDLIKSGKAKIVFCGGTDEIRDVNLEFFKTVHGFSLNKNYFLCEGSAFIVLENSESALARKSKIYCEMIDYCTNSDYEYNQNIFDNLKIKNVKKNINRFLKLSNLEMIKQEKGIILGCMPNIISSENEELIFENIFKNFKYLNIKKSFGESFGASGLINVLLASILIQNSSKEKTINKILNVISNSIHIGGNFSTIVLKKFSPS